MQHKSTTHQEEYFHIQVQDILTDPYYVGTIFCRKEDTGWFCSAAYLNPKDQFCRRKGRNVARRRYFSGVLVPMSISLKERPTYDDALEMFANMEDEQFRLYKE